MPNVNKKLTKSQPIKKVIGNTTSALTETSGEKKNIFQPIEFPAKPLP